MNMSVLKVSDPEAVEMIGVDYGGYGKVIAQNPNAIVIKWPRGTHWAGVGMEREYHPAQTAVYRVIKHKEKGRIQVEALISWENTRKGRT